MRSSRRGGLRTGGGGGGEAAPGWWWWWGDPFRARPRCGGRRCGSAGREGERSPQHPPPPHCRGRCSRVGRGPPPLIPRPHHPLRGRRRAGEPPARVPRGAARRGRRWVRSGREGRKEGGRERDRRGSRSGAAGPVLAAARPPPSPCVTTFRARRGGERLRGSAAGAREVSGWGVALESPAACSWAAVGSLGGRARP